MTTFTKTIRRIRTTNIGEMQKAIKQVEWVLKGELDGQSFELPQTTTIADPSPEVFIPLTQVTPENVSTWIDENCPNMTAIEDHIQIVLDRMVEQAALEEDTLPWAPAEEIQP